MENKEYNFDNGKWLVGNCLELMKSIPDNSIDMILCDLPYGTTACKWDSIIPFEPLWEQYERIIKDYQAIVLFGQEPFSSKLRISNLKYYKYDMYWRKNRPSGHTNAKLKPLKDIETISIFSNGTTANGCVTNMLYNPQGLINCNKQIKLQSKKGQNGIDFFRKNNSNKIITQTQTNYPRQVIDYSMHNNKQIHPTQKPVPLFEYLIKTYTNEGMTILDNTAGSGTTAIAAENTNRKWICMEQSEEYSEKAIERIKIECYGENPLIHDLENKFK